jgi:hypothetical protein
MNAAWLNLRITRILELPNSLPKSAVFNLQNALEISSDLLKRELSKIKKDKFHESNLVILKQDDHSIDGSSQLSLSAQEKQKKAQKLVHE